VTRRRTRAFRRAVLPAVLAAAAALAAGQDLVAPPPVQAVEAITRPSRDVTLSFVRSGQIARVLVEDGDPVEVDQLLIEQDLAVEEARLAQMKAEAEDDTRVRAAEAQLAQKRVDLRKLEEAAKRGAVTAVEVEHARLDVTISELSLKLAQFQREQAGRSHEEARLQIERMRLKSPIAGLVQLVVAREGQSADALEKLIRIVAVDPLWADVPVPMETAAALKAGAPATVSFVGPGRDGLDAKVTFVSPVADAASGTRLVRVEVPNGDARPAGERIHVWFPNP